MTSDKPKAPKGTDLNDGEKDQDVAKYTPQHFAALKAKHVDSGKLIMNFEVRHKGPSALVKPKAAKDTGKESA